MKGNFKGLEGVLENLSDPLVRFQMTYPDASLKIQKLGSKTIQAHGLPRIIAARQQGFQVVHSCIRAGVTS